MHKGWPAGGAGVDCGRAEGSGVSIRRRLVLKCLLILDLGVSGGRVRCAAPHVVPLMLAPHGLAALLRC